MFHGIGIFSNLKSTNLFTSNQGTEETSKAAANQNGAVSLFANKGASIFNNTAKMAPSSSLFGNNQTTNNEDEGSGDSA